MTTYLLAWVTRFPPVFQIPSCFDLWICWQGCPQLPCSQTLFIDRSCTTSYTMRGGKVRPGRNGFEFDLTEKQDEEGYT